MNKKTTLVPLEKINPYKQYWKGTKLRHYNVGLNVKDKEDDYYDYILALLDSSYFILVNITENNSKAGSVNIGFINKNNQGGRVMLRKRDFINYFGDESKDWYIIQEEFY